MTAKKATAKKAASSRRSSRPGAIRKAVESGKRRDVLVALGKSLADRIDNPETAAREFAPLVAKLLLIQGEIEKLDAERGGDDVGRAAATADEAFTAG